MSTTANDIRNAIRTAVGRFEREVNARFTKEELAAIANDVGYTVDADAPPTKGMMRAGIRWKMGLSETEERASGDVFSKADLETIAETLDVLEE